ncbi:MAG: RNA-binding domain-containing protein, partial [Pirellulales bacterium]
ADTTRWLGHQESQTLEFTRFSDARGIATSACALLNTAGGVIAIGVADDGAVAGVDDAESKAEEIDRSLRQRISPAAALSVINTEADDKPVIIIDVPNGPRKPYVVDGKVFVRVGEANRAATADDINRLIQDRVVSDEHWEQKPAVGMTIEDLDETEIERTIRHATEAGRFDASVTGHDDALRRLNLIVDGRPIQAAVVAFGAQVMPWYPQCSVRLARFRGVTKDEFIDQRMVSAHAFRLLDGASGFLKQHVPIRGTFAVNDLVRQDQPLYPILALREALVNALCHRDYAIPGGAVSVAMFDDRLEIASTGTLPRGLSMADLKRDHFSQPRNPVLADLFYRRGLIELWGR